MLIETQLTKDTNVINFFPPAPIAENGVTEIKDSKSVRKSPLAENIFDIGDIRSILITPDMISITKAEDADWEELKPLILAEIMDYISTGAHLAAKTSAVETDELVKQITSLIDARIRPAIQQDGGDIVFKKFENGIVYVSLQGNCVGCPYALVTLKEGVERIIKAYIPEVKSVENFNEES